QPTAAEAAAQVERLAEAYCDRRGWHRDELHMAVARAAVVEKPSAFDDGAEDFSHLAPERVAAREQRVAVRPVCHENGLNPRDAKDRAEALRLLMTQDEYESLRPRAVEPPPVVSPPPAPFTEFARTRIVFQDITNHAADRVDRIQLGGDLLPIAGIRTVEELCLEDRLTVNE